MKSSRLVDAAVCALTIVCDAVQLAQQNPPHVGYVYPAGGRQGTTFRRPSAGNISTPPTFTSPARESAPRSSSKSDR